MYRILFRTHDLERSYQPRRAEFLQIAGLALGAASSLLGGVSSANAAKKAEQLRQQQDARNNALFNRRYNESYVDTASGRNAIRQAQDYAKSMTRRAEGAAAVTGGTDAAVAQAKESANKMIGDTIGNLAAQDTARKENAENTYLRQQEASTAQQIQNQQQRANSIAQAAQGASNAIIQGASMLNNGGNKVATTDATVMEAQQQGQLAKDLYNQLATKSANTPSMQEYADVHGMPTDEQITGKKRSGGLID